jgi:hypothetical protein
MPRGGRTLAEPSRYCTMDTVLDILQAAGIGAAIGIRPFLPVLLVGALAAGDIGINFEGTDFAFLEEGPFLLGAVVGLVAFDFARRRAGEERLEDRMGVVLIGLVAVALAALEGGGSLDDHGRSVGLGMAAGIVCAVLALVAVPPLFARVRTRLGTEAGLLPLYREGVALVVAAAAVLAPPLALVVIAALVWLLLGGQRREGEKYAGLRILR